MLFIAADSLIHNGVIVQIWIACVYMCECVRACNLWCGADRRPFSSFSHRDRNRNMQKRSVTIVQAHIM